jgi:hypothetical protein
VLAYVWPVLDTNVTRDIAHLTKVPFACHAETGRVACAVNVDVPWQFSPRLEAPTLVEWDQDDMDEALSHFHARGISDDKAAAEEEKRRRKARECTASVPMDQEGDADGEDPEVAVISDKIMAELERKAEEGLCDDMEDLVEAPARPSSVPTGRAPRQALPRKLTFKRKKSPLVPEEGEEEGRRGAS